MRYFLVAVSLIWYSCTPSPQGTEAQTAPAQAPSSGAGGKVLTLSSSESKVVAVGAKVTGKHEIAFPIQEGNLQLAENAPCLSSGKIVLDIAHLEVLDLQGEDKKELEEHLRSEDFFLTEKYPTAIFEITGCEKGTGDTILLSGNLTMRGVTKNIRFPAVFTQSGDKWQAKAAFYINRQEWGIAYRGRKDNLIRDEVDIRLEIVAQ
ncbi:MAG: YceI family protein [Bacteroidia bacterium]|nr:YceI family protein [Bacteroidia bacterium]MDW8235691.1 YceI family protein [Bacteroidia bacterium]